MFRSPTILRKLVQILVKVALLLKKFSKITSLYIVQRCGSMLPFLCTIYDDVILLNVLTEV